MTLTASVTMLQNANADFAKASAESDPGAALPFFKAAAEEAAQAAAWAVQTIPSSQAALQAAAASTSQSATAAANDAMNATDPGTASNAADRALRAAGTTIGYAQQAAPSRTWLWITLAGLTGLAAGWWASNKVSDSVWKHPIPALPPDRGD